MKTFFVFLFFAGLLISNLSCSKEENSSLFANVDHEISVRIPNCKRYDELACVTLDPSGCAGTMCIESIGKSCKKAMPCTPIPGGCLEDRQQIITNLDIFSAEYADYMLEHEFIDSLDWLASFNLCKSILLERANSLE